MRTLLVVDDEFGVAEALEAVLADQGWRVLKAINGRQGLQRIAETRPDLILLDLMMPILDGPGMMRLLMADESTAGIPVIVMTGLTEQQAQERIAGYRALLRKPFRMTEVVAVIASVVGGT